MKSANAVGLLLTILILVALLAGGGMWLVRSLNNALEPRLSVGCTATVGAAGYRMSTEQAQNAALISELSVQRGMPARAASIALATAMQESALRNIDYGDRDSVGLFQQRPSQDWGTVGQIMDPVYSANAFYDVLAQVPDYMNLPINDAAQIVQRSGFPHAYAQHEPLSRAFASALTGQTPGGLNCTFVPATTPGNPDTVTVGAQAALGPLAVLVPDIAPSDAGTVMTFEVPEAHGWMLAHWALANADELGIVNVSHAGQIWDRNQNHDGHNVGWQPGETGSATQVLVTLAAPEA